MKTLKAVDSRQLTVHSNGFTGFLQKLGCRLSTVDRGLVLGALLLASPALAGIYPMNGGDLRRENHSLAPTSITNPEQVKWIASGCANLDVPAGGPVVLNDRVIQAFVHGVRCVDRATGNPIWTWPCNDTELYYTPAYDPDRDVIYVCRMDGSTVCLSTQTGAVLWYFYENNAAGVGQFCSPTYMNGKLYVGNGGAGFCCLDPDSHQVLWRFDFTTYFGYSFRDGVCTPGCDNGYIYFGTRTGHYFCLKASDGSCVWHVYKKCWHQNALLVSDNYVYLMNNQADLECRSRVDGSLVWSTTLTGTTDGNLAICGSLLIVPGDSWRIWALDMNTGAQVWCTKLTGNFARNTPFVACGKVFISACHGDYYGLDGQTGKIEWRYHHGVEYTFVDWAEADGNLFVACRDGRIFCFEPVTPGNPANCQCNLGSTPVPTNTPTNTPTFTPTPTSTKTPVCMGGLCLVSDASQNTVYFDANGSAPANDGSNRNWQDPYYQNTSGWGPSYNVTQPPGEWVAPCSSTGANRAWIAPFASGLPPTLSDSFFRNVFTLPGGVTVTSVNFTLSGDNEVQAWLNGNYLGDFVGPMVGDSHLYTRCAPVAVNPGWFLPGTNVLAFRLINTQTFHGLTYECCVGFTCSGAPLTPTPTYTSTFTATPTPTGTWNTPTPTFTPTITSTLTPTPTFAPGSDCTFTQGYWKTHNKYATLASQMLPWPISEDTMLCGMTWYNILQTDPKGNAWLILAHQWIAAKLNMAKGASAPADVQAAMAQAATVLSENCSTVPASQGTTATTLGTLLDQYNNGIVGPGHCSGDTQNPTTSPVIFPNPANGKDPVHLHLPDTAGASDVKVKVYTLSYRKVAETTYPQVAAGTDLPVDLKDDKGAPLANGLYYLDITYNKGLPGAGSTPARWTGKLLVLR